MSSRKPPALLPVTNSGGAGTATLYRTAPDPTAITSTFQIGDWNPLNDSFTLALDLNDGATFRIHPKGLKLPQPDKSIIESGNVRVPGVVVPRWQYKARHIQVEISLRGNSTVALQNSVRALLAAIEQPPYCIRLSLPGATQYSYADVLAVKHDIPTDTQQILAKAITRIHMDFTCRVGLRGDRVTLQNLIPNPGLEQPSGPGVAVFGDSFTNFNLYSTQSGAAPSTTGITGGFFDTVSGDSPTRYYRLNELPGPSVTAYDARATGNNGTYTGGYTLGTAGLCTGDPDTAVTFNGSSGYVNLPTTGLPTANGAWSIACIVQIAAAPGAAASLWQIGATSGAARSGVWCQLSTTRFVQVAVTVSGVIATSAAAISTGAPHLVVVTWDGTTLSLYVDNAAVVTAAPGAMALTYASGGAALAANYNNAAPSQFLPGILDECAIFTGATLAAGRVSAYYNAMTVAPASDPNTMVLAANSRVAFGSPSWGAINTWQVRFRPPAGGTLIAYLHYTDAANYLAVQIANRASWSLVQATAGVVTTLASGSVTLSGLWYWLVATQFPSAPGEVCDVAATIYSDSTGSRFSQVATLGPTPTPATTAFSGQCQLAASGAAVTLGGAYSGVHVVSLFGPGGWNLSATSGGSYGSGAWEQNTDNTYPSGPVQSTGALRIDAPPAGAFDVAWRLYPGSGSIVGSNALPATGGQTLSIYAMTRSSGLANTASASLIVREYDANGNFLRQGQAGNALAGTQATWTQLGGTYTPGVNCAYVDVGCRLSETTGNSANGIVWFDNLQAWNQTTTGVVSGMPWCDLRSVRSPAQLVVSGLLGDMVAPAYLAAGTFFFSWPTSGTVALYAGRKLVTSPKLQMVGSSFGAYTALLTPHSSAALDSGSYGGYVNSSTVNASGWNPRFISPTAADGAGVYHLLARVQTGQTTPNLPNITMRVAIAQQTDPWFNQLSGVDIVGQWTGPYTTPFTASNTWLVVDAGQCNLPPFPQGALTDPRALWLTPRGQWADSSGSPATGLTDWEALLPIDGSLLVATLNNPSNSFGAVTNQWLWTYADGLLLARGAPGDTAAWTTSIETGPTPNPSMGAGGVGNGSSGAINVNSGADPYLTLDPTQIGLNGVVGVNQLVAVLADQAGDVLPVYGEVSYSPLYLYPR